MLNIQPLQDKLEMLYTHLRSGARAISSSEDNIKDKIVKLESVIEQRCWWGVIYYDLGMAVSMAT